jgi:hypothetical protein
VHISFLPVFHYSLKVLEISVLEGLKELTWEVLWVYPCDGVALSLLAQFLHDVSILCSIFGQF